MKKFYIHTMGCKSNQFEGLVIAENLTDNGLEQVANAADADIFVLNSCTVTHKSDSEAFYLLRNAKAKNPAVVNVLTGCIAQVEKDKLLEGVNGDFVDYVVGNDEKFRLYEILGGGKCSAGDIMQQSEFNYAVPSDTGKTRASLKIQDGCDNRCSYCIIPFARGKSRSASAEFIVEQVENLAAAGFQEVVFTGIHIGQWGKDIGAPQNFPQSTFGGTGERSRCSEENSEVRQSLLDLLKLVEQTAIPRYRLGSLNPLEISDEMLEFLSASKKFCPHFHLSLQSACDKTLQAMNRHYKVDDYLAQIEKINATFERPFVGSDIIVGFAGETDEDFETTRQNLERSGLTQIHVFPYSRREGTAGAAMPDQVPDKIKEERAKIIREISARKYKEFITKNIGATHEILIEKKPDKSRNLKGMTRNYLTLTLNLQDKSLINTLQTARITGFENGKIFGNCNICEARPMA
jgi:threonylcarbamoyladenosine tRNA methylthiotransferase MtaB